MYKSDCALSQMVPVSNNVAKVYGLSRNGPVESRSLSKLIQRIDHVPIDCLESAIEGSLGGEGPAKDDGEAREEAEEILVSILCICEDAIGNLQESLAANSLEHLGVVGLGGLLADGQALKGVRLHGSANGSHGAEERELAALNSAGGRSDNDGRHVD